MGIKSINILLKKDVPGAFMIDSIDKIKNYRVAIDGCLKIWSSVCVANKAYIERMIDPLEEVNREAVINHARDLIINFTIHLVNFSITPIWVFDGKPLDAKLKCKKNRSEQRENISDKIKKKRNELELINPLLRSTKDLQELKNLMVQYNTVSRDEINHFRMILQKLGFPCVIAQNEGEKMCSSLAREGLAIGVWGNDTDNYALGTPLLITDIEKINDENMIKFVDLREILKAYNKPHKWFVDLCILSGCDFNESIPGVGPSNAKKLLEEYDKIENITFKIPKKVLQDAKYEGMSEEEIKKCLMDNLNYELCREIFKKEHSGFDEDSEEINFSHEVFIDNFEKVCDEYNMKNFKYRLQSAVKNILEKPLTKFLQLEKKKKSRF